MLTVIQRVTEASVTVEGKIVGQIGPGLLALVSVVATDTSTDVDWTARKLASLRIFRNGDKHFDLDVTQVQGSILLVSNFTIAAATRQGRRPSFDAAADAQKGNDLFAALTDAVRSTGIPTQTGVFRADMQVHLINDGPATFILDSSQSK